MVLYVARWVWLTNLFTLFNQSKHTNQIGTNQIGNTIHNNDDVNVKHHSNTMESKTVDQIIQAHTRISRWSSKLVLPHGNSNTVDVSCATYRRGHKRQRPLEINMPSNLPKSSLYQFDPELFCGEKSVVAIESAIKSSCDGCTLHRFRYGLKIGDKVYYALWCACYRTKLTSKFEDQFIKNNFSKDGLKPEHVIQSNSKRNRAFKRMGHYKLKPPAKVKSMNLYSSKY